MNKVKFKKITTLTGCHSEGNEEIMHVSGVGTQHPAQGVQQPSDDRGLAAPTGVNEQANERSCHRTLKKEWLKWLTAFYFPTFLGSPHMKTKNTILLELSTKTIQNHTSASCAESFWHAKIDFSNFTGEHKVLDFQGRQTRNKQTRWFHSLVYSRGPKLVV